MDARRLTAELDGTWRDTYGTAPCPAHRDHCWALEIRDGDNGVGVHCAVGCSPERVTDALEILGLWDGEAREKVCEVCGKAFTATRRDTKTCSSPCRQKAYRRRVTDRRPPLRDAAA